LASAESDRFRLQPLEPRPTKISVTNAPAGLIADRPTRPHVLYRANLYRGDGALWDANGRNWNS
jgi:hypothetical protein